MDAHFGSWPRELADVIQTSIHVCTYRGIPFQVEILVFTVDREFFVLNKFRKLNFRIINFRK